MFVGVFFGVGDGKYSLRACTDALFAEDALFVGDGSVGFYVGTDVAEHGAFGVAFAALCASVGVDGCDFVP